MINKKIDDITIQDLNALVVNSVNEGKSIEFKQSLPGGSDGDRKEFLADVSSFANTSGGDIVYGIIEEKGVASFLAGVEIDDVDELIRRYDSLIRDSVEPRMQVAIRPVRLNEGKWIIVLRCMKSWVGPHRVVFKGHDKFYARNSAGKYPLDIGELRIAFGLSNTLAERIREFKADRIASIVGENTPSPLRAGGKIILHLIPMESFEPTSHFNLGDPLLQQKGLKPIYGSGWNYRINLEGILTYASGGGGPAFSYVQLYRNGMIEAVDSGILRDDKKMRAIPSVTYERELIQSLGRYLAVLKQLGANTPIFIFLTIAGAKGWTMGAGSSFDFDDNYPLDRDLLCLPESLVESYGADPAEMLRPIFDLIWNACGYEKSFNFDKDGKWIH